MNIKAGIILGLIMLASVNLLTGVDELFEFKHKLLKKYPPGRQWHRLHRDAAFSLDSGKPEALLKMPTQLRIRQDKIYILDNNLHKIVIYNRYREFIGILGKPGKGPGDLYYPSWFGFYNDDLYIYNDFKIDVFSKQLKFLRCIKPRLPVYSFTIGGDTIFCTTNHKYRDRYPLFLELDMNGRIKEEFHVKDLEKPIYRRSREGYIVSHDRLILILLRHWNRIYVHDRGEGSIKTVRIKYDLLDRIEMWNDRPANKREGSHFFWFANISAALREFQNVIYILLKVPRLEIIGIDTEGNIVKHLYNDRDFRFMRWKDFAVDTEGGRLVFYVMGYSIGDAEDEKLNEYGVHRMFLNEK